MIINKELVDKLEEIRLSYPLAISDFAENYLDINPATYEKIVDGKTVSLRTVRAIRQYLKDLPE